MRMKRAWIIGLLAFTAVLCGCEKRQEEPENTLLYEDEIEDSDDYIVVGFAQVGSESDWRLANTQSFRDTFREENGYYLLFEDGQQKQENQIKAIRNFILQEVDYIILDPIVETGWDAVLQEAKAAGIPVILSDRLVVVEDESLYTCWVGSDFEEEGRIAGRWLKDCLEDQGRGKEEIRIVTLQGTLGSSAQIGRTEGFDEILNAQSNWNMLERMSGDFTLTKGREVMKYFLATYEDIDVVVCENDNMAFGAIEAIQDAGKTCGPDGDMILISFDAAKSAFEAMQRGELNMDVECNPLLGPKVEEIIQKLERGEEVDRVQYVEERCFDASMDLERIVEKRTY
ncbi:MAG: ABC transporter substrate-binding protein [Lachnospiraceae bacterium]|nr:ABC transporter substrate-binding protein [Lachnospiraceae bacterium]